METALMKIPIRGGRESWDRGRAKIYAPYESQPLRAAPRGDIPMQNRQRGTPVSRATPITAFPPILPSPTVVPALLSRALLYFSGDPTQTTTSSAAAPSSAPRRRAERINAQPFVYFLERSSARSFFRAAVLLVSLERRWDCAAIKSTGSHFVLEITEVYFRRTSIGCRVLFVVHELSHASGDSLEELLSCSMREDC